MTLKTTFNTTLKSALLGSVVLIGGTKLAKAEEVIPPTPQAAEVIVEENPSVPTVTQQQENYDLKDEWIELLRPQNVKEAAPVVALIGGLVTAFTVIGIMAHLEEKAKNPQKNKIGSKLEGELFKIAAFDLYRNFDDYKSTGVLETFLPETLEKLAKKVEELQELPGFTKLPVSSSALDDRFYAVSYLRNKATEKREGKKQ